MNGVMVDVRDTHSETSFGAGKAESNNNMISSFSLHVPASLTIFKRPRFGTGKAEGNNDMISSLYLVRLLH